MAVEAPADITILGLNRISIEVGLYARFLGYRVNLFGRKNSVGLFVDEETEFHGERQPAILAVGLKAPSAAITKLAVYSP